MDKLKENAYWISLGAIVVVLGVLVWFLVVARIFGSGGDTVATLGSRLERSLASIKSYNSRDHVPTQDYEEHLKNRLKRVVDDHNQGVREYNDAQKRFNLFFDGTDEPPDIGLFASTYSEKLRALVQAYRTKFGIEAPKADEDDGYRGRGDKEPTEVPDVSRLEQAEIFEEAVVRVAMKEYWIVEAIFEALTALDLGGLQKIGFPNRLGAKDEQAESEHYSLIDVEMSVEMPFSKIEDLITRLFEDDRVLFVFDGLEVTKKVEHLKPHMALKALQAFESADDAERADYSKVVPEPNVSVAFTFKIVDWKGLAEIEESDLKDDEEADEDFDDEELE